MKREEFIDFIDETKVIDPTNGEQEYETDHTAFTSVFCIAENVLKFAPNPKPTYYEALDIASKIYQSQILNSVLSDICIEIENIRFILDENK